VGLYTELFYAIIPVQRVGKWIATSKASRMKVANSGEPNALYACTQ